MTEFTDTLSRFSKVFRAATAVALRPLDLHLGQNLLIASLGENDGQTPGELAAAVDVTTPTIVKMTSRMITTGLLKKTRDETDSRLVRLHLTEAGRALLIPLDTSMGEIEERLTRGMTPEERATLLDLVQRVIDNALSSQAATGDEPDE